MATVRSRALLPVGSSQWIASERDSARQFTDAEVEEFAFSVRNEVDWLNEHMTDIFSRQQLDVAEVFKTPGKLRGKTPRTARKRNPLEERAPLTDIFANSKAAPSPPHETQFYKQISQVRVAEDPQCLAQRNAVKTTTDKAFRAGKQNADSGYHGMSSDDMDLDEAPGRSMDPVDIVTFNNTRLNASEPNTQRTTDERRTTEGSYHSAPEELEKIETLVPMSGVGAATEVGKAKQSVQRPQGVSPERVDERHYQRASPIRTSPARVASVASPAMSISEDGHGSPLESQHEDVESRTPSDGSSPVRPFMRKNSLKLPSLPAREPLATKRSIGARASRTSHLDQLRANGPSLAGYQRGQTGGKGSGGSQHVGKEPDGDEYRADDDLHGRGQLEDASRLHNKTSTQRLNEQIHMLGQSRSLRLTKSVPYPELPQLDNEKPVVVNQPYGASQTLVPSMAKPMVTDDEDDWIPMKPAVPIKPNSRPNLASLNPAEATEKLVGVHDSRHATSAPETRPMVKTRSPLRQPAIPERGSSNLGHHKNASTSRLPSPTRPGLATDPPTKPISVSNPTLSSVFEDSALTSTTTAPTGSPTSRRFVDGPSSAKAKLTSMLKSAKGLFVSSASVSAAAKMESFSPHSSRIRAQVSVEDVTGGNQESRDGFESMRTQQNGAVDTIMEDSHSVRTYTSKADSAITRGFADREEKQKERLAKEQQRNDGRLEKARERERQKAAIYGQEMNKMASSQKSGPTDKKSSEEAIQIDSAHVNAGAISANPPDDDDVEMAEVPAPAPEAPLPRSQVQPSQVQKPRELRRPTRPTKASTAKPKPAPVAIQVYTSQRELDHRKNGQIHPSNSTLATNLQEFLPPPAPKQTGPTGKASNASLQTTASSNSVKGSISSASTRPKPLIMTAAARKKEQEEREARRKLEHKREMERKHAAQQEEERRQEQERIREAERLRERERIDPKKITAQKQAIERRRLEIAKKGEQKNSTMGAKLRSANNSARPVEQEKMLPPPPPHRGEMGAGRPPSRANTVGNLRPPVESINRPAVQPNPARPPKRVLPPESGDDEPHYRQTNGNGGPFYQQTDSKRRRTNEEFEEDEARQKMPPPVRQSVIRKDAPNKCMAVPPPQGASHGGSSLLKAATTAQHHMQHGKIAHQMEMAKFANAKIPFADNPNAPLHKTPARSAKSSPRYQNGEEVELPEVPTDSEGEEEEGSSFAVPGWVNSPFMRTALMNQELIDPEEVFGPVAPLHMEEIFRDNARQHRLKNRSSSANWSGQDALTQEDIQSYTEERERLIANGGWTYKMS
ncbi:MAG: hypothetical protein M1839_002293 [Geoglossum umbratile]|nr:MAG: hypothetical protein M1839_002293 [Geoglossum umbratile]